jgi:hypothetical protein
MSSSIDSTVADTMKPKTKPTTSKRKSRAMTIDESLEKAKGKLSSKFHECKHSPRGTLANAVAMAENRLQQDSYLMHFRADLGDATPANIWKEAVEQQFEQKWDDAVKRRSRDQNEDGQPLPMDVETDPNVSGHLDTFVTDDENQTEYRTCSVTLDAVLNDSLDKHSKRRIEDLLNESQNTVADVVDELQVIMHKAVFAVSWVIGERAFITSDFLWLCRVLIQQVLI